MSKEMVFASSTAMVDDNLLDDLIGMGSAGAQDVSYLKFGKNANWLYGVDDDVIGEEEVLYVDASSFVVGYILWDDGKVKDETCVPVSQRANLVKIEGADGFLGVNFKAMEDGLMLQYKTSSHGGKKLIQKLMKDVGLGMKEHGADKIAMVTLSADSYKHKNFGTINTPEFTLVGWAGPDGKKLPKLSPG